MNNQVEYTFCMKQFKPAVIVIVATSVLVIVWTTYNEMRSGRGRPPFAGPRHSPAGVVPVATAPTIRQGVAAPHPNWGTCTMCHNVLPAQGNNAAGRNAAATMMVGTAPPIRAGATQPHPSWGSCTNCHAILGGKNGRGPGRPVAATMPIASAAPPIGIWVRPLTPATAGQLGLDNADGVLITSVENPSPASRAGLSVGDVITRIDTKKVESINEALAAIAEMGPTDTVKLRILRNGKSRKIFVTINDAANMPTPQVLRPAGTPVVAPAPKRNRIAVAATSTDVRSQVAPAFGSAPVFILYEPATGGHVFLDNPGAGTLTAGQQAVSRLSNAGVGAVIAGNIGPGSLARLRASGITVYSGAFGSVQEVFERYLEGALVPASGTMVPTNRQNAAANPNADQKKVAVAAQGRTLTSPVAADLGMAPYLIVYDLKTGQYRAVAKQPGWDQGNNSTQTAHLVVDRGASAVIAGNISPDSVRSLSQLGVFAFAGVTGSAGQAVELYRSGQLKTSTAPAAGPTGRGRAAREPREAIL